MSSKFKKEVVTKVFKQKTVHELKLPHESFLFWRFDFNRAKTGVKSQFVPLNQKLPIMPKSGIMGNFQLMLANYPTFAPLSFLDSLIIKLSSPWLLQHKVVFKRRRHVFIGPALDISLSDESPNRAKTKRPDLVIGNQAQYRHY